MSGLYERLKANYADLPEELPPDWSFPAPPVCTAYWTNRDWVAYAANHNLHRMTPSDPVLPVTEGRGD